MTENILKFLEKKGIVIREHQIQPLMAQLDNFRLLTNNFIPIKLAGNNVEQKHVPYEHRYEQRTCHRIH